MSGEELRQRLAEALHDSESGISWHANGGCTVCLQRVDALLPGVEQYGRDCAAETWAEAADLALAAAQFDSVPPIVRQANRLMAESFRENATAVRTVSAESDQGWKCPWCQSWNPSTAPRCSCCEIARDHRPASPQEPLPPEPFEPDTP